MISQKIATIASSKTFRAVLLLGAALTLTGARKSIYGPNERAAYLSPVTVDFLRPGLKIQIISGTVGGDGSITVVYSATDPQGLPLDVNGVYTPGPLSIRYVAAYIPQGQSQFVAYTTATRTGAATGSIVVAGTDTGGTLTQLDSGKYQYVFKTKTPAGFDSAATTRIGVYGSRTMTAFGIPNNYSTATYDLVPNGAPVTTVRDVVRTASCNNCHDQLSAHGGSRRSVELCVMCHTPQTVDSATGNTVDFKVFIHKLHMGSQLPSVVAGTPYKVANADYSTVVYPADARRCETCHDQKSGAVQAANYLTKPSAAACGSCHDDVNLATGKNHVGGPQLDDNQCANCHIPKGELDFDASIMGGHVIPADSTMLNGVQVSLKKVDNGSSGQKPIITFSLLSKAGTPLLPSTLGTLSFTMAGPTSDYGYTNFGADVVNTTGYVTESALTTAKCGADGTCTYAFTHAVPAKSTGSFSIGVEARRVEVLLAGTTKQTSVTYGAKNQVINFSVDGTPVAPRRAIVATANCQRCHVEFTTIHGGLRNQTEYCVLCHNPSMTDFPVRPAAVNAADKALPPQAINFNMLAHRIHTGENLAALGSSYTIVGFGGSHNDFSDVRYPAMSPTGSTGDTRNCSMCHVGGSEQTLPLGKNLVTDPQGPINPDQPITAACTGCHADRPTASHALANTETLGETCTVCHKSTAQFSVSSVHAQY